jgi:hypothetical protein
MTDTDSCDSKWCKEWIFEDPIALQSIKRGLKQKGKIDRGSFKKYIESDAPKDKEEK